MWVKIGEGLLNAGRWIAFPSIAPNEPQPVLAEFFTDVRSGFGGDVTITLSPID